jgi:hypothetical protein
MNDQSPARKIEQAQIDAIRARRRFASTLGALQYRLRPGTIATDAWEGVREKSGELADEALQKVKARPVAVSGAIAAFILYLAREPILRSVSGLFSPTPDDDGLVMADLDNDGGKFDLTAPAVAEAGHEGVSA